MQSNPTSYYPITQSQKHQYTKNGHILLKNITTPTQFTAFHQQMLQTITQIKTKGDTQQRIDNYSQIFTQVTNIWKLTPPTINFILNKKFAQIAAQLLQVQKVRIYHDQALVKQPLAPKTPWHQDYYYWPIDSSKIITMWLPLHPCPRNFGTMTFASGSHRNQGINPQPITEGAEKYYGELIQKLGFEVETYDLEVGDATFHSGRTIHCAHSNQSSKPREVITVIYFEDGAKAMTKQQLNQFRQVDLKVFCPGIHPGDVINSELNPIVN